jgi:methylmalonyl-CoA mutase N-terminal domain/subunit
VGRPKVSHTIDVAPTADRSLPDLLRRWTDAAPAGSAETARSSSSARVPLEPWYGTDEEPGSYPYTRGRSPAGYLDELWVMGMYSGYGTPSETNARFRRLLEAGQTGLSIALDLPTQMGLDSDDPRADGEVGKVGTPLDTVDDLLALLDGLPLDRVRQMRTTANAIGPIFAAFALVALEELGVDPHALRVMLQNDPLKEFTARGTFIFPPHASLVLAVDVVEYFAANVPHWEPIEFCGYHIRDAGATAVQEVAIATANGMAYLDEARRRGVDISEIAPSLFLFLSTGVDVFEEAAKLRAARRLWARLLHEWYDVPKERAAINLFVYTLGGALTAQEPMNNVVRVAYETLAAVLGGAQTLATSSYDEAMGLPTPAAAHLSLRTQQIAAHESGAANVVDPLGGSHYVEELTDRLEAEIVAAVLEIVEAGGAVATLESGELAQKISDSAYRYQREVESGERKIVGVSVHPVAAEPYSEVFKVPVELQAEQRAALAARRGHRDEDAAQRAIDEVARVVAEGQNCMPAVIDAARSRATLGEITAAIGSVVGFHRASKVRL